MLILNAVLQVHFISQFSAGEKMSKDITILVVDDEDYIRDSVKIILETEGFHVICTDNGYEALKIMDGHYVDIVLSDIKMPEMDGITLLKKIKEKFKNVEVLLITGYPSLDSAVESVKLGAYDYITKPFKVDDLVNKIQKALDSKTLKKQVVELQQLVSIYDSSNFFSKTLNHDEILNQLKSVLQTDLSVDGFYMNIFTRGMENFFNFPENLKNFLESEYSFKKCLLTFKSIAFEKGRYNDGGQDYNFLILPMFSSKGLWGIFAVYKRGTKTFRDIDIKILNIYVSQCSLAMQNSLSFEDLSKGYIETVTSLSKAVDAKDHYTRGHSENVKNYSLMIVDEMGFNEEFRDIMFYAGLLHDIGKIGVPTEIIIKPDKLSDYEYEEIKKHSVYGKEILEPIEFLGDVPYYVLYHHEQMDGSGYPYGLTKDEIPLGSRILQVADSFDAMTTDRSYRPRRTIKEAIDELDRCKDTQFDAEVVRAFKSALKKGGFI